MPFDTAIIGLSCRFPGAGSPLAYWENLKAGSCAVGPPPKSRGAEATQGGFLERVDAFDAAFFGMSKAEARLVDPQQRLFLEVAWEAVESAALAARRLRGARVGVFAGAMDDGYTRALGVTPADASLHRVTGNARSSIANRVSYFFDWRGPSMVIDTAQSSSLAAVHLACRALGSGEVDLALAGGSSPSSCRRSGASSCAAPVFSRRITDARRSTTARTDSSAARGRALCS